MTVTGRWARRGDRPSDHPAQCGCLACVTFLYAVPDVPLRQMRAEAAKSRGQDQGVLQLWEPKDDR
jgi:hypothetical protein